MNKGVNTQVEPGTGGSQGADNTEDLWDSLDVSRGTPAEEDDSSLIKGGVDRLSFEDMFDNEDEDEDDKVEPKEEPEETEDDDDDDESGSEDGDTIPEDKSKNKSDSNSSEEDDSDIIEPFIDLFHEELGWEIEDGKKPKSVAELVDYMKNIVEENSANNFADEDVAALNEYIKNGGNIHSYYDEVYGRSGISEDFSNIDIANEATQKQIVAANLRNKGYSGDKIQRTIERYSDAGLLQEEAADALDSLKEAAAAQKEQLVQQQRQQAEQQRAEEVEFFTNVKNEITKIDSIRGIPITKSEKEQLLKFAFQQDRDGLTAFQKEYYKNLSKNLIESAYFVMKGDAFVQKVQRRADTNAAQTLRERLRSKASAGKNNKGIDKSQSSLSMWETVAKQFR